MRELGKHLSELRKNKHLKQKELAERLNVSQQVISNIERGQSAPDIELLKKMADLYGISLDHLVGREYIANTEDDVENKIIRCIQRMDHKGKELSLGLVSQVAQHQGSSNGNQ